MKSVLPYFTAHYGVTTLGELTWGHAINSRAKLQQYLNAPQTHFLECDVILSAKGEVVLAHPPLTDSDLSFADMLEALVGSQQGLKIDFKHAETIIPVLSMLHDKRLRQPVLLNAGICHAMLTPSVNPTGFLGAWRKYYPQAILSPDWANYSLPYTQQNIDDMLTLVSDIANVTFPVNACLTMFSWPYVQQLLTREDYSLTIWNSAPTLPEVLDWLRRNTDPTRVSYDCMGPDGEPWQYNSYIAQ